jgi:hypothetical protein
MSERLTLREALASDLLADFVLQAEALGAELASGSDFERAPALLITQRRSASRSSGAGRWECGATSAPSKR